MELSQPANWVNKAFIGYIINTEFSDENTQILSRLVKEIKTTFQDDVFCMPNRSLHTTLLDWIAPLVDYGENKDKLFMKVRPIYDKAMREILSSIPSINVQFNEIRISPSTIFMTGHDNGKFQEIREQFLEKVELLPHTKLPPQIIHSSLARFTKPIDLGPIRSFIGNKKINITQEVSDFRLIRTTKEPMLEFEVLKRYKLNKV